MKVLVLAGGDSDERAVSLASGAAICHALQALGHDTRAIDPATGTKLVAADGTLVTEGDAADPSGGSAVVPLSGLLSGAHGDIDLVFIGLHGGGGENGSIQNLLDLAGKKYTGSGMAASAIAMNKALTKRVMESLEIPTPRWTVIQAGADDSGLGRTEEIADRFGVPLIVKPNDGGSTIGLSKVEVASEIDAALAKAAEHSPEALVEAYIKGRELTVAVLDGRAFPIVEIIPADGLYDYEAKYTKGKSEYRAPAEVTRHIAGQMQDAAVRLFQALGCRGLARVDFILDQTGRFFCLEINTLPGMTALSLAPMAAACEGIGFEPLIQMIIDSALKK